MLLCDICTKQSEGKRLSKLATDPVGPKTGATVPANLNLNKGTHRNHFHLLTRQF
jgi:hypothetical protein